jgi:Tfp pilus assembly protein PilF
MRIKPALIAILSIFTTTAAYAANSSGAQLTELRERYALRFFDAEAHVALARGLYDAGHRLTAFSVLETARTGWFGDEAFDAAYAKEFRRDPFDNSPDAEKKLLAQAATSTDAETFEKLGDVYLSRGDWNKARTWLRKAIAADPTNVERVEVLAEVERRDGRSEEAEKLLAEFRKNHPKSAWSLLMQAVELRDQDPLKAMATVDEALRLHPENAPLHRARAALLQDAGKNDLAAAEFVEAVRLGPKDAEIQGWAGRFFLKVMKDEEKALEYYLNAYFLDPHFYDTEHAEFRVKKLAPAAALRSVTSSQFIAPLQRDPWSAGLALQQLSGEWKASYASVVAAYLRHDDGTVRWTAQEILAERVGPEFDDELQRLLADADSRVRGLALYLAVKRWKERGIAIAVAALTSPQELVRYDAMSALLMHGGAAGEKAVAAYRASGKEPSAALKKRLDGTGKAPANPE